MSASDDPHFTYSPLSNEDKDLLLKNGYIPGELPPEDERSLLRDLRDQEDDGNYRPPADERDSSSITER